MTSQIKFAEKMREVALEVRAKLAEEERYRQAQREAELSLQRDRVGELAKSMLRSWYPRIEEAAKKGEISVKLPFSSISPLIPSNTKQEDVEMACDMAALVLHLQGFDAAVEQTAAQTPGVENPDYYCYVIQITW